DAAASHPELADQAKAWDDLTRIQVERAKLYIPHTEMDGNRFFPGLLSNAISLVRIPVERAKPNAERLPEYTDQALVQLKQELLSAAPVYKDVEELRLRLGFSRAQRNLGADDPFVRKMLGNESPAQLAHRLVSETKLDDVKVREQLFKGGQSAVDSSKDPM